MSGVSVVFLFVLCLFATLVRGLHDNERKPYIVYMGEVPEAKTSIEDEHHNLLMAAIGDEDTARQAKIYSYGKSFNGFAARLLPREAQKLSDEDTVVSVFANTKRKLHTTRSWDFLGMPETSGRRNSKVESNIIIGLLDTGIYVNAPSFDDNGFGPAPAKWKGKCMKGVNFTGCNNKVIGAKYFNLDNIATGPVTPADDDGHGTHTSSTAAGVAVKGASFYGIAKGTARGGVPSARIAMYKVCWGNGCSDMDLLAGFDHAIADGVDLISVSIGGPSKDFFSDPIAIGSFHAMKRGVLTSCSGGNDGPSDYTVENVAPWIMTVAASSIDRQFQTEFKLGNGVSYNGLSINTFSPKKRMYPLISGTLAANASQQGYLNASACDYGSLSQEKVKGRVVYCEGYYGQDDTIKQLDGIGIVTSSDSSADVDVAFIMSMPGTTVSSQDSEKIDRYINSTKNPRAVISRTRTTKMNAPFIAAFSSRGPQQITLNILKPDLAAPGLNILAAYSKLPPVTEDPLDNRHATFNILSGTSMACPHAAAAAAYVKRFHPNWSPAAIKSALMTTAVPMKIKDQFAELSSGSGQINPVKAVNPGLVYDIPMRSYISFLCKEGYNGTAIALLTGGKKKFNCSSFKPAHGTDGLNYPSMHLQLTDTSARISAVFYRTVTNVGPVKTVYKARVTAPEGVSIQVVPDTLKFDKLHENRSFKVVVKGGRVEKGTHTMSGSLEWRDSRHRVKSPILVFTTDQPIIV
ncbi:subtilisin-like protease SBT4.15 [Syzygium oleosum]|uniref:subtilisin-like protease SBT4.15 n=1 Tax=Syzygium oleosum TaxID=219896 RepID=UPI0011D1E565|nr:subtilisin-like protease SBT4.15 [Syzygium oleosum]